MTRVQLGKMSIVFNPLLTTSIKIGERRRIEWLTCEETRVGNKARVCLCCVSDPRKKEKAKNKVSV